MTQMWTGVLLGLVVLFAGVSAHKPAHTTESPVELATQAKVMEQVQMGAKMTTEAKEAMKNPAVAAALGAGNSDAVDKLIRGILEGRGHGGVVTSEFNADGVHATIISNVNELKVVPVDDSDQKRQKAKHEEGRKRRLKEAVERTKEKMKL